ncbi:NB-ARC domain-containing protein [Tumidithrix elongata RA019]|uniref:NB-ARC domain-containing protein n=1 Tax=Tumidithrix elongata BACA0141 TaxID=2716417 RepID=A0AAW9PX66_9CYAN|nr:NB-ARC domain-containing protein [Tumidithrix elongata RA019]
MADTLKASEQGLTVVDRYRQQKKWTKSNSSVWWLTAHTSKATLRRFWAANPIQRESFIAICKAVGISDWEAISAADDLETAIEKPQVQEWGEAPDLEKFYGRKDEIAQLEAWFLKDACKLIAIWGMGGIGKTALALTVADRVQEQFDYVIWRSLQSAPSLSTLLQGLLTSLSLEQVENDSEDFLEDFLEDESARTQQNLMQFIECLKQKRCLIVLDGIEAVFQSYESKRPRTGYFRRGYEDYELLLQQLEIARHQSCIVLTSREKPEAIALAEHKNSPVRSLTLKGLQIEDAAELFKTKGFSGEEQGLSELVALYSGNPLALRVIATMIQEYFKGNITYFLSQNTLVLGDRMRTLLNQQIERLSDLEKELIRWLTIEQTPVTLEQLRRNLLVPPSFSQLIEAVASLERRSLLEKIVLEQEVLFTLPPLAIKYVMDDLVEQSVKEIDRAIETQDIEAFQILRNYALIESPGATSDREIASRLLTKIGNSLIRAYKSEGTTLQELSKLLSLLQGKSFLTIGYAGYNLHHLLRFLGVDVSNYDLETIAIEAENAS